MPKNIPHLHPLNAQLIHIDRDQIRSVSHSIQKKKEYCIWKWSMPMFFSLSIWCLADVNWSVWMKYASYFVNGFVFLFYFFLLTDFVPFFVVVLCCSLAGFYCRSSFDFGHIQGYMHKVKYILFKDDIDCLLLWRKVSYVILVLAPNFVYFTIYFQKDANLARGCYARIK